MSEIWKYKNEISQFAHDRNRTINVPESLHSYFKNASIILDTDLKTLITNILLQWKKEHGREIHEATLDRFKGDF